MIFILGFATADREEIPAILYLGHDGDTANRIAECAPHPRVARMVNPQLFPVRHWTEEAAAAFAAQPPAASGPVSEEAALAMLDRIETLEALLAKERVSAAETLASALAEIERLKSPSPSASSEIPAADEPVMGAAAESSADASEPAGPQLSDEPPATRRRR